MIRTMGSTCIFKAGKSANVNVRGRELTVQLKVKYFRVYRRGSKF